MTALWLRHEVRASERRVAITPPDAGRLVDAGVAVTVERSPQRVFPIEEYAAAGCAVAGAGEWADADRDIVIVGLKELPADTGPLRHRHVYFGHAYKGQAGAGELLGRFAEGGGALLDLEYLTDEHGRRLTAFGYWAGYVGAALAVLHHRGALTAPLTPTTYSDLDAALRAGPNPAPALVIGALGRCGTGARDALATAGITATAWDLPETRDLDRQALMAHEIVVNAVLTTRPVPPFVTRDDLHSPGALRVLCDVTCDATSAWNVLPVYDEVTTWDTPTRALGGGVDLIAIDNLPSLLPREASTAFSADLLPLLLDFDACPWQRALDHFTTAVKELDHA